MDDDDEVHNSEESSTSFGKFVREHMTSILKPIAEHVDELQKRADTLAGELADTKLQLRSSTDRISHTEGQVKNLGDEFMSLKTEEEKVHVEVVLGGLGQRVAHLEAGEKSTRDAVTKLEVRADGVNSTIEALQQALDNSSSSMNRLQLKHWQTTNLAQRVESGLAELKDEHANLCERHTGLVRGVQQTQSAMEAHRLAVGSMSCKLEGHTKETADHHNSLKERVSSTDKSLNKLKELQLQNNKDLVTALNELKALSRTVTQLEDIVEGTRAGGHHVSTIQQRLNETETGLADVRQILLAETDKDLPAVVRDLQIRVQKGANDLAEINPVLRSHEAAQKFVHERLGNFEEQLTDFNKKTEDGQEKVQNVEADLSKIQMSLREMEGRMYVNRTELEKTRALQMKTNQDLTETQSGLHTLTGELGSTTEGLNKVAAQLDLAHEYIHGLGKGLVETHRSVMSGQDGMLAPKPALGGQSRTLPTLAIPQPRKMAAQIMKNRGASTPRSG